MQQGGIVNNTIDSTDALKNIGTSYEPAKVEIDKPTQTVAGQVDSILQKDSPLMKRAEKTALQRMNRRGLLNSSLAVGAGQAAMVDAALPIASQDASTYNEVEQINTRAENAALDKTVSNITDAGKLQLAHDQDVALEDIRKNNTIQINEVENQYKQLLQANQSASSYFAQVSESISNIMQQPTANISTSEKQALIDQQLSFLRKGLSVIGGIANLDLNALFD